MRCGALGRPVLRCTQHRGPVYEDMASPEIENRWKSYKKERQVRLYEACGAHMMDAVIRSFGVARQRLQGEDAQAWDEKVFVGIIAQRMPMPIFQDVATPVDGHGEQYSPSFYEAARDECRAWVRCQHGHVQPDVTPRSLWCIVRITRLRFCTMLLHLYLNV